MRVIELSDTPAGAYCGRLLAGMGAAVTMIEPPEGSGLRRKGPFRLDTPDIEGGASHLHLNRRKRSLRLDLRTGAGRRLLESQLASADVLVIDTDRRQWSELGIDPGAFRRRHRQLHLCTITPYGLEGPKSEWLGSELTLYAAGGYLGIGGEPDREPVKAWGEQGHLQAGLHAALGVVAALQDGADGDQCAGQSVDTAVCDALAFLLGGGYQHAWFFDHDPVRNGARLVGFGPGHLYPSTIRPCADGWVHAHCNNRYPEAMAVLFDEPRLAEPVLLAELMGRADDVDELMAPTLTQTPRREMVQRAQEMRIPFTEVLAPSEVMSDIDGHHASREFWQSTPHPGDGVYLAPGPAVRFGKTGWADGSAPRLGQDNERLGSRAELARWRRAGVA
ncbi:MAG: CoA transferase [Chloroflexi bacterium]|nr:CoA transferase [Chloroflexota bacterium]